MSFANVGDPVVQTRFSVATHLRVIAVALLGGLPLASQAQTAAVQTRPEPENWTVPRTADGHPDLQGVWANNNATPLERPAALAGKALLTDAEVAALSAKAAELFSGDGDAAFGDDVFTAVVTGARKFTSSDPTTGTYNQFWIADRDIDNRTSLITDPPDGRLPAMTPEARARRERLAQERSQRGNSGPEDRSLQERCITFGVPRLSAAYNSYFQIFQSADHVAILMETIHDARIIPLDGRPHTDNIPQWLGDSVGHWEGDTLVVDTKGYSPKSDFRGAHENLHVLERFTRVSANRIDYEVTVDDPLTWTRPWTVMIPLKLKQEQIYEFACHEGNEGMAGILAGARAEEKAAAANGTPR